MEKFINKIQSFLNSVKSKIAFYPSLMGISGVIIASVMLVLEQQGISRHLMGVLPELVLEDGDAALTVLSVCIGGLISLMVFSFSMVMLLLSQASSNFSPRLLPGLISDKDNQIILGTYLATILYNIFILFSLNPSAGKEELPGFSVLLAIIFTIICLASFIYFTHTISQDIQINNIVDDIFIKSEHRLKSILKQEEGDQSGEEYSFPDTGGWYEYSADRSGYFQNLSVDNLLKIAEEHNTRLFVTIPKGFFVLQHATFVKSEKELDEETVRSVLSNIVFSRSELVEDNYILSFKQLTEIAVRAMSPGVNDPGTAITAIDYLAELFTLRMKKKDYGIYRHENESLVKVATVSFEDLLYNTMASLRTYCRHDPVLAQKLLWMLRHLAEEESCAESYDEAIKKELTALKEEVVRALDSEYDKKHFSKIIEEYEQED